MADYYVDFSTGDNSTGDGSSGTPWKTIQYAIDNGSWSATGVNYLHNGNNVAEVLTAPISLSSLPTGVNALFVMMPWDNGGSLTTTTPAGDVTGFEIDGNDVVSSIFEANGNNKQYVVIIGGTLHSTTSYVIQGWIGWQYHDCDIYDGGGVALLGCQLYTELRNCRLRDSGGSSVDGASLTNGSIVKGCEISGVTGSGLILAGGFSVVEETLIHNVGEDGIEVKSAQNRIHNNTIDGGGVASKHGINISNAVYDGSVIFNNLITNWSGTGAMGIAIASGATLVQLGPNGFYNNTTNQDSADIACDRTGSDVSESSDPYTDRSTGDYSLDSGALSVGAAYPSGGLGVADIGALQSSGGGGGGGSAAFNPIGNSFIQADS